MTATSINVNKQTVNQFLQYGAQESFVFPPYQRPYSWGLDETNQLFDDVWAFSQNEGGTNRDGNYFLGCFVFYSTGLGLEIVDGQQRMTTITLLLRALYTILDEAPQTQEVEYKKSQIAPTIWKQNRANGTIDFSTPLIESKAVDDKYNDIFHDILRTGVADEQAKDNYSLNYMELMRRIREKSQEGLGMAVIDFCEAILHQCVVLPIKTDGQETAQTIFNTLNARGLALSDADIFKALIYGHIDGEDAKERFIDHWKKLSEDAADMGLSIQNLLTYYMFYLRAKRRDTSSTIVAIRTFYLGEDKDHKDLYDTCLLDRLNEILLFFKAAIRQDAIEGEAWSEDEEILKALDVLRYYPNEYWKYPTLIYYMTYKERENFRELFLLFLHQLTGELVKRFCVYPTLSAVKGLVLNLNVAILDTPRPTIDFAVSVDDIKLELGLKQPSRGMRNILLAILAYTKQETRLPRYWEVEHIFPQSWKADFSQRPEAPYIKTHLDDLGNFLPLEKKLNIKASDRFFIEKKARYQESNIAVVRLMASSPKTDWVLEDIIERGILLSNIVKREISRWKEEYRVGD